MENSLTSAEISKPLKLFRATSIVMVATLASAVFGLLRETVVAAQFGTTLDTDAYFFSYDLVMRLPEFLLVAIAAGLIPLYTRSKSEGSGTAFVSTLVNACLLFLLVITVLTLVTAPFIVSVLGSGFDSASRPVLILMMRLLSPAALLAGLWGVFKALLNAEGRFFVSTISQVFLSLGIIAAVILLAPLVGVYSLALGILIASVLQVTWTGYWLRRSGFQHRLILDVRDPRFRRFLHLLGPGIVGGLIGYAIAIIDKSLASFLAEGTIASLSFASRPMDILTRIAVNSFVIALLPTLSWEAVSSNLGDYRATVVRTLGILMFALTPLTVLLAAMRVPIIQLLFERGKFEAASTASTADIFAALVLGLMPMAIAVTASTVFTSLEDTKTPAYFGAGSNLISKLILSPVLIALLGAAGLALATSLMYVVSGAILLFLLRRRLQGIQGRYLVKTMTRIVAASLLAAIPVYLIATFAVLPPLMLTTIGLSVGVSLFLLGAALFRVPELSLAYSFLLRLKDHRVERSILK